MKLLSLDQEDIIVKYMKSGSLFIHPTDTIYGIGCNALKDESVEMIRKMKNTDHPFSIIAPSFEWIRMHTQPADERYLSKLPGPYTFILKKRKPEFLKQASSTDKLGIRVPDHPILRLVMKANVPFITTSANISGQAPIKQINQLPKELLKSIDYIIDGGVLDNKPSQVIDLTEEKPKILRSF